MHQNQQDKAQGCVKQEQCSKPFQGVGTYSESKGLELGTKNWMVSITRHGLQTTVQSHGEKGQFYIPGLSATRGDSGPDGSSCKDSQ